MAAFTITIRSGAKVARERWEDAGQALAAVERAGRDLERVAGTRAAGGRLMRRFEPVQQVVGRIQLRGPDGLRAGVDVRGDGSAEAFTGSIRRDLVEQLDGESAYAALRRVVEG